MPSPINNLFKLEDLDEMKNLLLSQTNTQDLRDELFSEFLKYSDYKCISDWNKAVRICKSLAIIGWGKYESLEALKGKFFNGNPETYFLNKNGTPRFVSAIWSKRTTGYTMESGRTSYHKSSNQLDEQDNIYFKYPVVENIESIKFFSQRNWIPKFPIRFNRLIGNCYKNSKPILFSIDKELQKMLNEKMQPEKYGQAINYITINHSHSYDVENSYPLGNINSQTNYIISNKDKKLSTQEAYNELKKIFSEKDINKNGYYLCNRFEYGPFSSATGKMNIQIYFEKDFAMLKHTEQKRKFKEYALEAMHKTISKLKNKNLDYNFDLMNNDFIKIISEWEATALSDQIIEQALNQENSK